MTDLTVELLFGKETAMTLENMIRGSGELGAILATAWGVKQTGTETRLVLHSQFPSLPG